MPRRILYQRLSTEQSHPRSRHLDALPTLQLLRLMNQEDARMVRAIKRQLPQIARAAQLIARAMARGGHLIFVGAGTSGRLGVLEAAECPPTFSTHPRAVQAIIAGGRSAVFRSREGAEDDAIAARRAVRGLVRRTDVLVGITASGVTPFVVEALRRARCQGAATVLISAQARPSLRTDVRIALAIGPELLSGSTRLKAGSATKLVLNMLTLGAMARLGKVYGNRMVDVRPTSRKLKARALGIVQSLTSRSKKQAAHLLRKANGRAKIAILMGRHHLSYPAARRRLTEAQDSLREALRSEG